MGWVGAAFLFLGRYLIGKDRVSIGLALSFLGDAIWTFVGWNAGLTPLVITGAIMAILDVQGIIEIRKKNSYWKNLSRKR